MNSKNMHGLIITSVVILAVALIIAAVNLPIEKHSDYITVNGQSELVVQPDEAIVYFSVNTDADTAKAVQEADSASALKVQAALSGLGRVETSNYYLFPKIDWTPNGSVNNGYSLTHQFKVTTNDLQAVSKIVEAAVGAGANGVDSINYELSQDSKNNASAQVMTQATLAARSKANMVVGALGLHTGRVLKVEESSWWFQASSAAVSGVTTGSGSNVISPQTMAIDANVNVVFEVKK